MEIIKRGKLPSERKATLTCNNCKTEFTTKLGEANRSESDRREIFYYWFTCPLEGCGHAVFASIGVFSTID